MALDLALVLTIASSFWRPFFRFGSFLVVILRRNHDFAEIPDKTNSAVQSKPQQDIFHNNCVHKGSFVRAVQIYLWKLNNFNEQKLSLLLPRQTEHCKSSGSISIMKKILVSLIKYNRRMLWKFIGKYLNFTIAIRAQKGKWLLCFYYES